MGYIPRDVVIEILSRLPIKTLVRCRCVSKSWHNLTYDSRLINLHLHRTSQHNNNNPSLVLDTTTTCINAVNFRSQMLFVENEETGNYTSVKLNVPSPSFEDFRVMGSCNGLLCLYHSMDHRSIAYVYNPCNGDYIKLPDHVSLSWSPWRPREIVGGFGFDPETNEYKVVAIVYYYGRQPGPFDLLCSEVHAYGLGDSSWSFIGEAPYFIFGQFASKAFVNGALHWVGSCPAKLIVSFDIADQVFDVVPRPEFGLGKGNYSLGVLRGCLSMTDSSFEDRIEVWVMNNYRVKESWTKYFTINFSQVGWNIRYIQTLCYQKNGEVLLLYNHEALLSYSPRTMRLSKLSIAELPSWFEAITYVGTLISPSRLSAMRYEQQLEDWVKCKQINKSRKTARKMVQKDCANKDVSG